VLINNLDADTIPVCSARFEIGSVLGAKGNTIEQGETMFLSTRKEFVSVEYSLFVIERKEAGILQ
jgi:hypothetical protein